MIQVFNNNFDGLQEIRAHDGINNILANRLTEKSKDYLFDFLDFIRMPPNSSIGEHRHTPDNQEIYIIIEGSGEMSLEGQNIKVEKGDIIVNRLGGMHGLMNNSNTFIDIVIIQISKNVETHEV